MAICPFCKTEDCETAYHELTFRTLQAGDPAFMHQHAVDAYAAQHAHPGIPTIGPFFALAGLYLALEKGFTGREVQMAHMAMAKRKGEFGGWPTFHPPESRGEVTVRDMLRAEPLDVALHGWMKSVWAGWEQEQTGVREATDRLVTRRG